MDCREKVLCGTGEVELDPNIVSEEAGKLYAELQVSFFEFYVHCKFFTINANVSKMLFACC